MVDPRSVNDELGRLVAILDKEGDAVSAKRMRQLMIAVGGDPSAEDWAAVDIQSVIDPAAIAQDMKSRRTPARWIGVVEWLRNGLVLVPLILTWAGISFASQHYQELVNKDRNQELHSFLYLWQNGFNNTLPAPFILNNLALADCVLLATIFALTLIATFQYNLFHTNNERRAEEFRTRLSHALGDAALCLAMARRYRAANQPSNLNDISKYLFQFSEQFKKSMDQFLAEMAEERKRRGDMTAFMAALDRVSKDMLAAASSIQQTNADLGDLLKDILVPVKSIPQLVTSAGQAVGELNRMTASLAQMVADLPKWRQELQTALTNGLNQLIAGQKQAEQELRNTLGNGLSQINTSLGQQIAEQGRMGQELHALIGASFNQLLGEQKSVSQALIDAARDLETATQALGNTIGVLSKAASDQAQVLSSVQGLQGEQRRLTAEMAAVTVDMRKLLKTLEDMAPELRSMAVDMSRFNQELRNIPQALNAELLAPLQHYSSAAARINAGADLLGRASQYFESVVTKLDGRLGP
jgi:ABC-type transporter Mla subunit MlaD